MEVRVVNGKILDMDMKSAGISVLREMGQISEQLYLDLTEGDKLTRNITVGKAMRDSMINGLESAKIIDAEVKKYV